MDRPRQSDCIAGQIDGEAGWWTTSGNIGLPPLARVMGVGRQHNTEDWVWALPILWDVCLRLGCGSVDGEWVGGLDQGMLLLLFALGHGSSQSRFSSSR